jgi:LacI family transcriptional regulator
LVKRLLSHQIHRKEVLMGRVTLQVIANEMGLSKFAVSRAIAGKTGVSEGTRQRVQEVATRLGYKKPQSPRQKPLSILFNANDVINSELQMQIQTGVQIEAQKLDLPVRSRWLSGSEELESLVLDSCAVLVVGPHDGAELAKAYKTGVPILRSGWIDPLEQVDMIGGTDHEAGRAVAEYLVKLGHKHIVYVHGDAQYRGRMERLYGVREVVELSDDIRMTDMVWDQSGSFAAELNKLWDEGVRPTSYFCAHDGLAVTVISELLARGIHIPRDVSVVGFGDYSAAQQIQPPLTTVKAPGVEVGRVAVRFLKERISSMDGSGLDFPLRIHVPNRLIERLSCGPAPRQDKRT